MTPYPRDVPRSLLRVLEYPYYVFVEGNVEEIKTGMETFLVTRGYHPGIARDRTPAMVEADVGGDAFRVGFKLPTRVVMDMFEAVAHAVKVVYLCHFNQKIPVTQHLLQQIEDITLPPSLGVFTHQPFFDFGRQWRVAHREPFHEREVILTHLRVDDSGPGLPGIMRGQAWPEGVRASIRNYPIFSDAIGGCRGGWRIAAGTPLHRLATDFPPPHDNKNYDASIDTLPEITMYPRVIHQVSTFYIFYVLK